MKKPSDPSLIGSATSYMLLGPMSFSRIQPNIHMLIPMNIEEIASALYAIRFEFELETKSANKSIDTGPAAIRPYLMGAIAPPCMFLY
jgi:hypothetical protein